MSSEKGTIASEAPADAVPVTSGKQPRKRRRRAPKGQAAPKAEKGQDSTMQPSEEKEVTVPVSNETSNEEPTVEDEPQEKPTKRKRVSETTEVPSNTKD
ncbi:hypothetical protein IWQ62_004091, partial [Dispira parvispora]